MCTESAARSSRLGAMKLATWALLVLAVAAKEKTCPNSGLTLVQKRHVSSKALPAKGPHGAIFAGEAVRLRTLDGKYLRCEGAKVSMHSEGSTVVLGKPGNAALRSGDVVTLSCSGRRLAALQGAVEATPATQQQFILQRQQGDGQLRANDEVFVLNAKDLQALKVEGESLKLRLAEEGAAEAFVLELARRPTNRWVVLPNPDGVCDATLRCHRRLNITCRTPNGTAVSFSNCSHEERPWSYEPCYKSPMGACIDVAESDCTDLPGTWWNSEDKTCADYGRANCRDPEVKKACGETCATGQCRPKKTVPVLEGCHDDPFYRSAFNWHCAWFKQRNCSEYLFRDELTKACPKSCNLC